MGALTPCIKNNPITLVVEYVLRIAQAFNVTLLRVWDTTPGHLVCGSKLNAVKTNSRVALEKMNRWSGALGVDPSNTALVVNIGI